MCAVLSSLRTFSSHFSLVAFPLLAGYFLVVNHVGSSPAFVCFPSRGVPGILLPNIGMCNFDRHSPHALMGTMPGGTLEVVAGTNVRHAYAINFRHAAAARATTGSYMMITDSLMLAEGECMVQIGTNRYCRRKQVGSGRPAGRISVPEQEQQTDGLRTCLRCV